MRDLIQRTHLLCPDCQCDGEAALSSIENLSRRDFLKTVGRTVGGIALASAFAQTPAAAKSVKPETLVKTFYDSLSPRQKELICMPWDNPLRSKVGANWAIVKTMVSDFTPDQQEMTRGILRGLTTQEWYPRLLKQMENDSGTGGVLNYHVAIFGDPDHDKFEWVITGRHCTLRADGHSNANAAFGGPIFYGHAPKDTEDAGHPGNIYWEQGQKANAVFAALDGKQREIALLDKAPNEDKITLQGEGGVFPGIAVGDLSHDQRKLVEATIRDMLSPYRPSDADDVMKDIAVNGGLDRLHLSFYKQDALGHDGIWDIWRLEGPSIVWHFRGAPHVHTWVNVARDAKTADGRA
jgi:hypothetical protein